jgi:putative oxidoreductase
MNAGRLIARATIGGLFVSHGVQKLFGWFGGPGLEDTAGMMDSLELRPPRRNALAAGLCETLGGTLLVLGALTPVAAASLSATMFTAIRKVHLDRGLFNTEGGYEYNLTLIAAGATGSAVAIEAGKHFERRDPASGRFAREEASDAQPVTTTS